MPLAFLVSLFVWTFLFDMSSSKTTHVGLRIAHVTQDGFKRHSSPNYAHTYSRSTELCSVACQREHTEGGEEICHASNLDTCDFGTIDNCTIVVDSSVEGAERVALNKDKYEIKTVKVWYSVANNAVTDFLWDKTCTNELANLLPNPLPLDGKPAFQQEVNLFNHKAGIMACGGFGSAENGNRRCQFWQPGEAQWKWMEDAGSLKKQHRHGTVISLGYNEAIIVGFNTQASAVEIYSGGVWTQVARHPIDHLHFPTLVAKSRWQIYCLGGKSSIGNTSIDHSQVSRYDRLQDKWTNVGDIPNMPNGHGGKFTNCGKITYEKREVIMCFGSQANNTLSMHALDLETETWSDLGMDAPRNDYDNKDGILHASSVFREGNRLYRLRGLNKANHQGGNRLDVFDADRKVWEPKVNLDSFPGHNYERVMIKVKVVIVKN